MDNKLISTLLCLRSDKVADVVPIQVSFLGARSVSWTRSKTKPSLTTCVEEDGCTDDEAVSPLTPPVAQHPAS
jgi:hypothetical protein